MKLDKNSGKIISKTKAEELTHSFQSKNPNSNKSYFIGSDIVKMILNQENCIGVRVYDGILSETGEENRVLVGVDHNGEDMLKGVIADELIPCPEKCPKNSSLMK